MDRSLVSGVIELPCGAHPTSNAPDYGFDVEHLRLYAVSAQEGGFADYRRRFVDLASHADYLSAVGGAERIAALPLPVF